MHTPSKAQQRENDTQKSRILFLKKKKAGVPKHGFAFREIVMRAKKSRSLTRYQCWLELLDCKDTIGRVPLQEIQDQLISSKKNMFCTRFSVTRPTTDHAQISVSLLKDQQWWPARASFFFPPIICLCSIFAPLNWTL